MYIYRYIYRYITIRPPEDRFVGVAPALATAAKKRVKCSATAPEPTKKQSAYLHPQKHAAPPKSQAIPPCLTAPKRTKSRKKAIFLNWHNIYRETRLFLIHKLRPNGCGSVLINRLYLLTVFKIWRVLL